VLSALDSGNRYVDLMIMREGLLSPARWLSLRVVTPTDYARHVGEFLYDGVGCIFDTGHEGRERQFSLERVGCST
jgi:hypothetical protein